MGTTTAQIKFGTKSALLNPTNNLDIPHNLDTHKSFTIAYWMYDATMNSQFFFTRFNLGAGCYRASLEFGFYYNNSTYNGTRLMCLSSKQYGAVYTCDIGDINLYKATNDSNQWVYIEISYNADDKTLRLFRNGVLIWSSVLSFFIGQETKNLVMAYTGTMYLDELMLIQACLHTQNFTPPTEPYLWSDNVSSFDENNIYGLKR